MEYNSYNYSNRSCTSLETDDSFPINPVFFGRRPFVTCQRLVKLTYFVTYWLSALILLRFCTELWVSIGPDSRVWVSV